MLIVISLTSSAQAIIGGEFSYTSNESLITFNVTTYSLYEPNIDGLLYYPDGAIGTITMSSVLLNDTVYQNTGSAIHLFLGPGILLVSFTSGEMVNDIRNVSPTDNAKFYMEVLFRTDLELINSAPTPEFPLLDFVADDACFISQSRHAIDAEGDSITYGFELFSTYGDTATESTFPEATDSIGIDLHSGEFYWRNAIYKDRYAFQYRINEYRDDIYLGTSMQKIITDINCGIVSTSNLIPASFSVSPNPVHDYLVLPILQPSIDKCKVINALGVTVFELSNPLNNQLNIAHLPPGMYVLYLEQGDAQFSSKFMKQ